MEESIRKQRMLLSSEEMQMSGWEFWSLVLASLSFKSELFRLWLVDIRVILGFVSIHTVINMQNVWLKSGKCWALRGFCEDVKKILLVQVRPNICTFTEVDFNVLKSITYFQFKSRHPPFTVMNFHSRNFHSIKKFSYS